jgi:prepilin-type N-terminal cleavage/methylation domain-containing protein
MRIMTPHQRIRVAGFTMVELLVTIGIVGLLAALAVPTLTSAIQNSHIRAASASLQNGLAQARAEAVRLNTQVEFRLTGAGWDVRTVSDDGLLHQASGKERATGVTITAVPANSTRATFDAFGRRLALNPGNGSVTFTRLDIAAVNATSSSRPMRIQLVVGGLARLCDPAAASTEPKACL